MIPNSYVIYESIEAMEIMEKVSHSYNLHIPQKVHYISNEVAGMYMILIVEYKKFEPENIVF